MFWHLGTFSPVAFSGSLCLCDNCLALTIISAMYFYKSCAFWNKCVIIHTLLCIHSSLRDLLQSDCVSKQCVVADDFKLYLYRWNHFVGVFCWCLCGLYQNKSFILGRWVLVSLVHSLVHSLGTLLLPCWLGRWNRCPSFSSINLLFMLAQFKYMYVLVLSSVWISHHRPMHLLFIVP